MVYMDVVNIKGEYRFIKRYSDEEALKLLASINYTYPHHPLIVINYKCICTPPHIQDNIEKIYEYMLRKYPYIQIYNLYPIKYKPKHI